MQSAVSNIHQALLAWKHTIVHHSSLLYSVLSQAGYQMSGKHLGVVLPVCFQSERVTQHFWGIPAVTDSKERQKGRAGQPARLLRMLQFWFGENPKNSKWLLSPLYLCCGIYCKPLFGYASSVLLKILTVRNKINELLSYTAESQHYHRGQLWKATEMEANKCVFFNIKPHWSCFSAGQTLLSSFRQLW